MLKIFVCFLFLFAVGPLCAEESLLPEPVDIALPFASKPDSVRGYVDVPIKKSGVATESDAFVIDFQCDAPDAIGTIILHFRSGKGWYFYTLKTPVDLSKENNRAEIEFSLSDLTVRTEGEPGPLAEADTIRFSLWRGASKDAVARLHDIRTVSFPIITLIDEGGEGKPFGMTTVAMMNRAGIPTGILPQNDVTENRLKHRKVVVLPLNYKLSPETIDVLKKFVEGGGKLVAFCQLPPELMRMLGFEPGKYVKSPEGDAAFAEIRFDHGISGDPFRRVPDLKQKSWNIVTATTGSGYGPKCAAWWYDAAGRKTEYPALLVSDRGAFFSHIVTGEDRENKQKFLAELFGLYDSSFCHNAVIKTWESLFRIGDPRTLTAEKQKALETEFLRELRARRFDVNASFFTKSTTENALSNLTELHEALLEIRDKFVRKYCESVPPRTPEFRAWWEHTGLGAYPGDWDRTMKELSETGFNAVIPNLLWGGSAHYASDVLPRSKKFERYGDQIEQATKAGKKYGVEVHAWQVCYQLAGSPPEYIEAMKKAGRTQVSHAGEAGDFLCPSHPENIDLETETFCELARKYKGLAGIHYDYIRYPSDAHCYCNGCRDRFSKDVGIAVKQWPQDVRSRGVHADKYEQWRCDQISKLVKRVHGEVKKIRPDMKISAAIFSHYPGCRKGVGQDWPVWVENGWLDFVCPMNYTESLAEFESLIEGQKTLVKNRIPLYPGIGATATGITMSPDRVVAQIEIARKTNSPGFVIFDLNGSTVQRIPPYTKLGATKK